ncbi:MAG TPA: hypothetical protein VIO57_17575, partial [Chloroflexota bacterium]
MRASAESQRYRSRLHSARADTSACVEHGVWTLVSTPPPRTTDAFTLHYKDIDAAEHDRIVRAGRMTFHLVGCSGDA